MKRLFRICHYFSLSISLLIQTRITIYKLVFAVLNLSDSLPVLSDGDPPPPATKTCSWGQYWCTFHTPKPGSRRERLCNSSFFHGHGQPSCSIRYVKNLLLSKLFEESFNSSTIPLYYVVTGNYYDLLHLCEVLF